MARVRWTCAATLEVARSSRQGSDSRIPGRVSVRSRVSFTSPKSATRGTITSPLSSSNTLPGLRSRCASPSSCACATPRMTPRIRPNASSRVGRCSCSSSSRAGPSMSGMSKPGAPLTSMIPLTGRRDATMQPTALLHEAWMKVSNSSMEFEIKEHFLAVAARAMRQILVDRSRARMSQKRGGDWQQVTLTGVGDDPDKLLNVLELDAAITKLEAVDPVAANVAVMPTFGGMTADEAAKALSMSVRSLQRSWRFARVFLAKQLEER